MCVCALCANVLRGGTPPCSTRGGLIDRRSIGLALGLVDAGFVGYCLGGKEMGGALHLLDGAVPPSLGGDRAVGRQVSGEWVA